MSAEPRTTHSNEVAEPIPDRAGVCARLCRRVTQTLVERWLGGVHAGLVVKSLYLQRAVGKYLKSGQKTVLDAGCGPEGQLAALLATRYPTCSVEGMDLYCANPGARIECVSQGSRLGYAHENLGVRSGLFH